VDEYWAWFLGRLKRQLWWQAVAYGAMGVVTAFVALGAETFFPWPIPWDISREAVASLLTVISSSMLAVTTFSLGAMTAAFGAVTSNVTPRATLLLMEDRVTHNVLSSFIGAFVFSIVSTIVLYTGSYGERGRAVLFVITIGVITLVVIQLLRWINHLISLGRVGATIERVEEAAASAIDDKLSTPYLGANPWLPDVPLAASAQAVTTDAIGYVQFIDMATLSEIAEANDFNIYIPLNAGAFIYEGAPLAWIDGPSTSELVAEIKDQFVTASQRSFEQDPRFGLIVMAEIGSRALSSATDDAGTALDVIGRLTRLLTRWSKGREDQPVIYPRLHLRPLADEDLFDDAFMIVCRDGAHLVEMQVRLQKALAALQRIGSQRFRDCAARHAQLALERAHASQMIKSDLTYIADEIRRAGLAHSERNSRPALSAPFSRGD
jgi:uncharacterized membrane protein